MYALFVLLKSDTVPKGRWGSEHHTVLHCACIVRVHIDMDGRWNSGGSKVPKGLIFPLGFTVLVPTLVLLPTVFILRPPLGFLAKLPARSSRRLIPSTEIPPTVWLTFESRR